MDLLVALSTSVAYLSSLVMMIMDITSSRQTQGEDMAARAVMTYFDSCVFLVFFILAGRLLEGRVRVKVCAVKLNYICIDSE